MALTHIAVQSWASDQNYCRNTRVYSRFMFSDCKYDPEPKPVIICSYCVVCSYGIELRNGLTVSVFSFISLL